MKHLISKDFIHNISILNGWSEIDYQEEIGLVRYYKDGVKMNIYLSTMTVSTSMKHPKKGKTQLFRRGIGVDELRALFANPRKHTNKGYY